MPPIFRPELIPLISVGVTLAMLGLTDRLDVRAALRPRLRASYFELFIASLTGRTVMLALCTVICFFLADNTGTGTGTSLGMACSGAGIGYLLNLPLLLYYIGKAEEASRRLRGDIPLMLERGRVEAEREVDNGTVERRLWGSCIKAANEDPEIAAYYYCYRRARQLAKESVIAGGEWDDWITPSTLSFRELFGEWDDEHQLPNLHAAAGGRASADKAVAPSCPVPRTAA